MVNPEKLTPYGTQNEEEHNAICVGHHYGQTITNNVNKTCALLQTIRVITKLPNSELKVKTNQIDSITHSWT
jgi:hypothetical protein